MNVIVLNGGSTAGKTFLGGTALDGLDVLWVDVRCDPEVAAREASATA